MNSSGPPSNRSESPTKPGTAFEQALEDVESLLHDLKQRYLQIKTAKQRQTELQQHLHQLQMELHQVKKSLETLEIELESHLLSWGSQREVFWQIVRFVGLGLVLGVTLKACTG